MKNLDLERKLVEEPKWLAWLADLDALACNRAGSHSAIATERAAAIGEMPRLAEGVAAEPFTCAAADLAIDMVVDPECTNSVATFLLCLPGA